MTDELEISVNGALGQIALNRPQAINALNLAMIEGVHAALLGWRDDPAIGAVVFSGNGPKGFCSGGDVRAARALVLEGRGDAADAYFEAEYRMNGLIATYSKPLIAISHGITMGGGIGIAGHCAFRITQPGVRYAMPESAIGFFADVGVNAILAKAPFNRALLFLLSGVSVGAADAVALGLADAVLEPDAVEAFRAELVRAAGSSHPQTALVRLMAAYAVDGDTPFCAMADLLPGKAESPADFVAGVEAIPELGEIAAILGTRSPGSLIATFFAQHAARRVMGVRQTLAMDLRLARVMARRPDFAEGVRAVLVDKDQRPHWSPARLSDVDVIADAGPILEAVKGP